MNFIKKVKFYKMYKWEIIDLKVQIGLYINVERLRKMMSQPELANEVNLSKTHISRIENGDVNITITTLLNLCNFLEIEMTKIFIKISDSERTALESELLKLEKEFKNQNKRKS